MPFVEMDPALVLKAIEGYHNELAAEKQKLDAFYRQFRCKRCKGPLRQETDPRHCFSPETLAARAILRCLRCDFLFDPHTGIVLELGDPDKVLNVPIVGKERP